MNNLRLFNEKLFNDYLSLDKEYYSCPNLVSSKISFKTVQKNPILYIGKETNGWVNYDESFNHKSLTLDMIEDEYDNFLINHHTSKTIFWKFIKDCLNIEYNELYKNIIWTNTLIVGKRFSKGTPDINDKIIQMSTDNLLFLYNYFNPSMVIIVAGNNDPYYEIIQSFFKKINSNLINKYPAKNNLLLEDKNIFWTYHPMWLNYKYENNEIKQRIYKKSIELKAKK